MRCLRARILILLEIARARAARQGKKVTFLHGEAASLPMDESAVDVILSVFALIFVPDPGAAAAEMSRVLAPGGRIVLSAWVVLGWGEVAAGPGREGHRRFPTAVRCRGHARAGRAGCGWRSW